MLIFVTWYLNILFCRLFVIFFVGILWCGYSTPRIQSSLGQISYCWTSFGASVDAETLFFPSVKQLNVKQFVDEILVIKINANNITKIMPAVGIKHLVSFFPLKKEFPIPKNIKCFTFHIIVSFLFFTWPIKICIENLCGIGGNIIQQVQELI